MTSCRTTWRIYRLILDETNGGSDAVKALPLNYCTVSKETLCMVEALPDVEMTKKIAQTEHTQK